MSHIPGAWFIFLILFIYLFWGTGVWIRPSWFTKHVFYLLSHTSSHFLLTLPTLSLMPSSCKDGLSTFLYLLEHLHPPYSIFFFLQYWGLNSGPTPWATPRALFCDGFFQDRVLRTICPGWLSVTILLISASWVARITGVSHWLLAPYCVLFILQYWSLLSRGSTTWATPSPSLPL
jgi:hypothetical protein